jgi:hypothetical protein
MLELSRRLFFRYRDESKEFKIPDTGDWKCDPMREWLDYRVHNSCLSFVEDPLNELGFLTERAILRWIGDDVKGMWFLSVPLGLQDHHNALSLSKRGVSIFDERSINLCLPPRFFLLTS